MSPEKEPSSVWDWHDFLKDSDFDENGEITIQVPHKSSPEKTLTVKLKRIDFGDYDE